MILKLTTLGALLLLLSASLWQTTNAQPGKCNVLVLEGGGDLGAYEAGVMKGIVDNLPQQQATWDLFSGISVGSIISGGANQFNKTDAGNHEMVDWLTQLWVDTRAYDVYQNWSPGGIIYGLLYEKGFFNSTPLRNYLNEHIFTTQKRMLNVGATDVNSAELIRFNETQSSQDLIESLMCSSAIPGIFPWQSFQGKSFFDGGVVNAFDVAGAVDRCRKEGKADEDIVLDLILVSSNQTLPDWGPNPDQKTFQAYQANRALGSYEAAFRQYFLARDLYPNIDWRYVIFPSKPLPDAKFPLLFNEEMAKEMIQQGIDDALTAINKGEGVQADELYLEAKEQLFKRIDPDYVPRQKRVIQDI